MLKKEKEYSYPVQHVGGVSTDGERVWIGCICPKEGPSVAQVNPATGEVLKRFPTGGGAGNVWDGSHLWQVTRTGIQRLNPENGEVVAEIPLPEGNFVSGLAWDGEAIWAGTFSNQKIYKLDPKTGAILRKLNSDRYVTGITWAGTELWHATARSEENGVELRQIDPVSGEVRRKIDVDHTISGLAHDGEKFWAGDCDEAKLRALKI